MSTSLRPLLQDLQNRLQSVSADMKIVDDQVASLMEHLSGTSQGSWTLYLAIFVLACFVGYYVVWRVTPALHSPLMSVTNAISSVIIVGALMALGHEDATPLAQTLGFVAVVCASVNIFGGFVVTQRMLHMFKKK